MNLRTTSTSLRFWTADGAGNEVNAIWHQDGETTSLIHVSLETHRLINNLLIVEVICYRVFCSVYFLSFFR